MSDWLSEVLNPFKSGQAQARLFVNDAPTNVVLTWDRSSMTIENLEDLPHVRLHPDGRLEISKDATEWLRTDEEMASSLQVYRTLDPIAILPKTEFINVAERGAFTIKEGNYSVNRLDLPNTVVKFFERHGDTRRWVRVSQLDGMLVELTQRDFPPFPDMISLNFFSPYFFHPRFWMHPGIWNLP